MKCAPSEPAPSSYAMLFETFGVWSNTMERRGTSKYLSTGTLFTIKINVGALNLEGYLTKLVHCKIAS